MKTYFPLLIAALIIQGPLHLHFVSCLYTSNLLCDGGFQSEFLTLATLNIYQGFMARYVQPLNNYNCWYSSDKLNYEVKQFPILGGVTQVADFIVGTPYTLCQTITLQVGQQYDLSFDFVIDGAHISSTLFCILNNVNIFNITSTSIVTPVVGSLRIVAQKVTNNLCFNTSTIFKPIASPNDRLFYGPVLDNVTLLGLITNSTNPAPNSTSSTNGTSSSVNTTTPPTTIVYNQTSNSSSPTNSFPSGLSQQTIIIHLTTYWNPYSGILYLYSDWVMSSKFSLDFFRRCVVKLNGEIQDKTSYYLDIEGYMYLQTQPNVVYVTQGINQFQVYLPDNSYQLSSVRIIFIINGKEVELGELTESEKKIVVQSEPYIEKVTQIMKQIFVYLNMFYCSFFILGIIQFWNLTLLYNFLNIQSVPNFAEAFFSKMINFFFTFNSLTTEINRITNKSDRTQSLFDFSGLTSSQKVLSVKDGHVWFAFSGMSSNFFANNFDSLVLLCFFVVKCLFLKLLVRILKLKFANLSQVRTQLFLSQLANEILCFTPFIAISALSVFCYMGETSFLGKINNLLHVSMAFWIILIPCLALIKALKKKSRQKALSIKKHKKPKDRQEKLIKLLINLLIPVTVVINNNIGFFVVISTLLLWKVTNFFISLKAYSLYEKLIKAITNLCWFIYHLCFLTFFIFDNVEQGQSQLAKKTIKYVGFTAILCLLVGGLFDIVECIIKFLKFFLRSFVYIYKRCIKQTIGSRGEKNNKKIVSNNKQFDFDCNIPIGKNKNLFPALIINKNQLGLNLNQHQKDRGNRQRDIKFSNKHKRAERRVKKAKKQTETRHINQFVLIPVESSVRGNLIGVQVKRRLEKKVKTKQGHRT